jgi:adenine-specific DNA-methyltransferase
VSAYHLSEEVGDRRSLLVLCGAFRAKDLDEFANLTVKKIPRVILTRCEWGKDDYSLEIKNLPSARAPEAEPLTLTGGNGDARPRSRRRRVEDMPLFGDKPE